VVLGDKIHILAADHAPIFDHSSGGSFSVQTRGVVVANWFRGPRDGFDPRDFSPHFNACIGSCPNASTIRVVGEHDVVAGLDASVSNGGRTGVVGRIYDFRGATLRVAGTAAELTAVLNLTGVRDVRVEHLRIADGGGSAKTGILAARHQELNREGILVAKEAAHNHFTDCHIAGRFTHGCLYLYRQENIRFFRCNFQNLEPRVSAAYATKWNDDGLPWQGISVPDITSDSLGGTTNRVQFQTCDFRTTGDAPSALHLHHCGRLTARDCYCRTDGNSGVFVDQSGLTATYGVEIDVWSESQVTPLTNGVRVSGSTPIFNLKVCENSVAGPAGFFAFTGKDCQILGLRVDAIRSVRFMRPVTPGSYVYNAEISVTSEASQVDLRGLAAFAGRVMAHPDQAVPVRNAANMLPADAYS
jgi:hypothetical protein